MQEGRPGMQCDDICKKEMSRSCNPTHANHGAEERNKRQARQGKTRREKRDHRGFLAVAAAWCLTPILANGGGRGVLGGQLSVA